MIRYLLPLFIFLGLGAFLFQGLKLNPRDLGSTRIDKAAPAFEAPQLIQADKTFSNTDFMGKVSIFNAWASWCVSCRQEHPVLMQLAQYTDIPIYGLNYKDTRSEALDVLKKDGNPYQVNAFDPKGLIGMDWGVIGTPETFIVDKQGVVRYKHVGPLHGEVLKNEILPLIKQLRES